MPKLYEITDAYAGNEFPVEETVLPTDRPRVIINTAEFDKPKLDWDKGVDAYNSGLSDLKSKASGIADAIKYASELDQKFTSSVLNFPKKAYENSDDLVKGIKNLFGLGEEERYQLWPEKVVREALTSAGDIAKPNPYPEGSEQYYEYEGKRQEGMVPAAMAISALAGSGGLGGTGAKAGEVALGATPFLRPALKHKEKLYKGKPGQEHQDIIPKELYEDFRQKAMSGEDLAEYNFGFINDKGHFLKREDALKYGIDTGIIDPHAGKFGTLTSTMFADSSKPGVAIEALKPRWQIKGFEDYNDWFHGTTHNFDKFSTTKGNPENYLGKNPHFTNSSKDASANYAGMGPDLTQRIELRAEEIAQKIADKKYDGVMGDNYGKIMTAAKAKAKEELMGIHEGAIIPANLKFENPISTVEHRPTWLDFKPKYDKAGEIVGESPLALKFYKSLQKQSKKYDFNPDEVMAGMADHMYDEVKASTFDKALRNNEALTYAEDRKTGKLISSDIIANIYKDMGFDGIVMDAKAAFPHMKDIPDGTLHAAPLKRNTVQSKITGQVLYSDSSKPAAALQANKPAFYSAVEHTVKNIPQEKMTGDQWLGTLANKLGVKGEELDWTGLKGFLEENKGKPVTKAQIEEHLAQNKIELKEVNKGGEAGTKERAFELAKEHGWKSWDEIDASTQAKYMERASKEGGGTPTKYHSYQLPGGENYREMLLTLPSKNSNSGAMRTQYQLHDAEDGIIAVGDANAAARWRANGADAHRQIVETQIPETRTGKADPNAYRSSHWDEPNILAHVRMNDRTIDGKKSLHLEEVQSDWHQQGRDKGYQSKNNKRTEEELAKEIYENFGRTGGGQTWEQLAPTTRNEYLERARAQPELMQKGGVPDAPFKKTWHELALKRMIREAAEKGYDRLSWTPGEAQAARYDLSKQLKELQYLKNDDGTYQIAGVEKNGGGFNHPDNIPASKLPDVVGKEMAEKIIKNEGRRDRGQPQNGGYFSGVDLKVGGEGMKGFYDQIIPKAVEKLTGQKVKKGEVETKNINKTVDDRYSVTGDARIFNTRKEAESAASSPIHYIDITPELKQKALQKGFPLFSNAHPGYTFIPYAGNPFENKQ